MLCSWRLNSIKIMCCIWVSLMTNDRRFIDCQQDGFVNNKMFEAHFRFINLIKTMELNNYTSATNRARVRPIKTWLQCDYPITHITLLITRWCLKQDHLTILSLTNRGVRRWVPASRTAQRTLHTMSLRTFAACYCCLARLHHHSVRA